MELIKTIWNLFVLLFSLSYFGILGRITYELGMSALNLHEKGLISLGDLNRQLMSGGTNIRKAHKNRTKSDGQGKSK